MFRRYRPDDSPQLDVHGVALGAAYVTVDRFPDGKLRAIQVGTGVAVVELVVTGDMGNALHVLGDLALTCHQVHREVSGQDEPTRTARCMGPNTFGAIDPDQIV